VLNVKKLEHKIENYTSRESKYDIRNIGH